MRIEQHPAPGSARQTLETATFKKGISGSREVLDTFKQYREYINNPKFKSIEAKEKHLSTINSSKFELSPHE